MNPFTEQWQQDAATELIRIVGGLTGSGYDSCSDFCAALRDAATTLEELHCGSEGKAIAHQILGDLTSWTYPPMRPVRFLKRKPDERA